MGLFATICNFFKGSDSSAPTQTASASSGQQTGVERYISKQTSAGATSTGTLTGVEQYIRNKG